MYARRAIQRVDHFDECRPSENFERLVNGGLGIGEWRLMFRASRDGFAASAFHSKCDNKGPTVTVVKSGANILEVSLRSRGQVHKGEVSFYSS